MHVLDAFGRREGFKEQGACLPSAQASTLEIPIYRCYNIRTSDSTMRRAQSSRHYPKPSLALGADDLGMLKENPDESIEDVLRRQLLEKDRENDKVHTPSFSLRNNIFDIIG